MSSVSKFNSKIRNLENDFLKAIHEDFVKLKSFVPELKSIRFSIYCTYNDEGSYSTYMRDEVIISFENDGIELECSPYEDEVLEKYDNHSKIISFINDVTSSDAETIFGTALDECVHITVNDKKVIFRS